MCQALQHGIVGPYVDLLLETACTVDFFFFLASLGAGDLHIRVAYDGPLGAQWPLICAAL